MNKISILILSLIMMQQNSAKSLTYVEQDLGDQQNQGLKYINDEVNRFVQRHNQKHGTTWKNLQPNAKTIVAKCKVNLKTQWLVDDKTYKSTQRDIGKVVVKCAQTVDGSGPWSVHVETTRDR